MIDPARSEMVRRTEWWLIRQGLPKFVVGQGFLSHTLPRMFPFLLFVAVFSTADLFEGLDWRVAALISLVPSVAAWAVVTRTGRRPPPPATPLMAGLLIGAYFAVPPLVVFVLLLTRPSFFGDDRPGAATLIVVVLAVEAVAFGVANVATRYGLVALLLHSVRHVVGDLRNSFGLLGRALPAVLFLTTFLFFTGEMWQLTNDLSGWRLALLLCLFAAVIVFAIGARLREELGALETSISAEELERDCRGTPLAPVAGDLAPTTPIAELRRPELVNILLVMAARQLIRAAVVGAGVFGFFVLFGVVAVSDATAETWIGSPPPDLLPGIPYPMVKVAALLAGFSSMYFAVLSMTDGEYRKRFFDSVLASVSRVLGVRAVYLRLRELAGRPAPAPPPAPAQNVDDGYVRLGVEDRMT